jgi:hypothetical protein
MHDLDMNAQVDAALPGLLAGWTAVVADSGKPKTSAKSASHTAIV